MCFEKLIMSREKAKAYFLGREGYRKLNCGQAVLSAFKKELDVSDGTIQEFGGYGGGKAPEGFCGAFYAAKMVLERHSPELLPDLEASFVRAAGSVKCREIRSARKLSCLGCVETAARYLEEHIWTLPP